METFNLILKHQNRPFSTFKASKEACQQAEEISEESRIWDVILHAFIQFTEDNTSWKLRMKHPEHLVCYDIKIICSCSEQSQGYYKLWEKNNIDTSGVHKTTDITSICAKSLKTAETWDPTSL